MVKGFEYEKDRYVVVEEGELEQMVPRSSRVMDVLEFVPAAEVDPVYLDTSYYVVPERAGEKPYTLLYEALRRSGPVPVLLKTLTDYVERLTVAGPVLLHGRGSVLMPSGLSMSKEKRPERAHIPEIGFCEEKNRLRHQFLKAIQKMTVLQDRQMHAVIEGDSEFSRFDVLLHIAQQIKEMAKYAWINHVESHGCGEA